MLATIALRAHLRHVTYKPGWRFHVYEDEWEGQKVRIEVDVADSRDPGQTVTLGIDSFLSPMQTLEDFDWWLMWRIVRIESHEAREFFKVDGQIVWDPHAVEQSRGTHVA